MTGKVVMDLVNTNDTRNVIDKYKGVAMDTIISDLNTSRIPLEIAVENLTRDFSMGTIIRTANAFNVARVHIVGSRQWNKRGAMKTDAYLDITYHASVAEFQAAMAATERTIVAVDIVEGARPLHTAPLPQQSVLVFGAEGPGLSDEMLSAAQEIVRIEQFGSTRSINVGVAAGIVMYAWVQQYVLNKEV